MNYETEIKVSEKFEGDKHVVYLMGHAHFDVARNPEKPFIIYTEEVQALSKSESVTRLQIALAESVNELDEVVVEGMSLAKEISLDPLKINTIDARAFEIQSVGAALIHPHPLSFVSQVCSILN